MNGWMDWIGTQGGLTESSRCVLDREGEMIMMMLMLMMMTMIIIMIIITMPMDWWLIKENNHFIKRRMGR